MCDFHRQLVTVDIKGQNIVNFHNCDFTDNNIHTLNPSLANCWYSTDNARGEAKKS